MLQAHPSLRVLKAKLGIGDLGYCLLFLFYLSLALRGVDGGHGGNILVVEKLVVDGAVDRVLNASNMLAKLSAIK